MTLALADLPADGLRGTGDHAPALAGLGAPAAGLVRVPVHPCAVELLRSAFPAARVLERGREVEACGPVGRVRWRGLPGRLEVVTFLGSVRPPEVLEGGVALSALVRGWSPEGLGVAADLGGVASDDGALSVLLVEEVEGIWPGERLVPGHALEACDGAGRPLLASLPGAERRLAWFSAWAGRLLDVVLPLLERGVLLPVAPDHWHQRWRGRRLVGLAVDGWWGGRVHLPTVALHGDTEGLDALAVPSLDALFAAGWHAVVARHLGTLIRLLELGPEGFRVVRDHVDRVVLEDSAIHRAWTGWVVPHPCTLRAHLEGHTVHRDLPNPLA